MFLPYPHFSATNSVLLTGFAPCIFYPVTVYILFTKFSAYTCFLLQILISSPSSLSILVSFLPIYGCSNCLVQVSVVLPHNPVSILSLYAVLVLSRLVEGFTFL